MEIIDTFDYLTKKNETIISYKHISDSSSCELKLPKSINDKYFCIFNNSKLQKNNKYFATRLNNIKLMCGDNGISGITFKTEDGFYLCDLNSYWAESINLDKKNKLFYSLESPSIFIGSKWGGWNLYHFLFTSLPKITITNMFHGLEKNKINIIHNSIKKNFIKEAFELLYFDLDKIICLDDYPIIWAKDISLFSHIGYGVNGNKECCFILKFLFNNYLSHDDGFLNIYIKRNNNRQITNEDEIIKIIQPLGFQIIELEKLHLREQIELFSKAKNIIAPHGAGLSHIVWSKPGTKLLEIFSPKYLGLCYWLIADSCELDYYYLIGEGYFDHNSSYWYSDGMANITVNIEEFKQTLNLMELI